MAGPCVYPFLRTSVPAGPHVAEPGIACTHLRAQELSGRIPFRLRFWVHSGSRDSGSRNSQLPEPELDRGEVADDVGGPARGNRGRLVAAKFAAGDATGDGFAVRWRRQRIKLTERNQRGAVDVARADPTRRGRCERPTASPRPEAGPRSVALPGQRRPIPPGVGRKGWLPETPACSDCRRGAAAIEPARRPTPRSAYVAGSYCHPHRRARYTTAPVTQRVPAR